MCKRHYVKAKRAVRGRSAPYDLLLAAYKSTGNAPENNLLEDNTLSPPIHETKEIFSLSDEFNFMFRECNSSDVLQLFRDNWHHYSRWIDGVHMKWQSTDFMELAAN